MRRPGDALAFFSQAQAIIHIIKPARKICRIETSRVRKNFFPGGQASARDGGKIIYHLRAHQAVAIPPRQTAISKTWYACVPAHYSALMYRTVRVEQFRARGADIFLQRQRGQFPQTFSGNSVYVAFDKDQ